MTIKEIFANGSIISIKQINRDKCRFTGMIGDTTITKIVSVDYADKISKMYYGKKIVNLKQFTL